MRLPNGFGNVSKLPGKRRSPYRARVTKKWVINEAGKKQQIFYTVGYYKTREEGIMALSNYHKIYTGQDKKKYTFSDVYNLWSKNYYPTISDGNIRAYKAAYRCCLPILDMSFDKIHICHIMDVFDKCEKNYPTMLKLKTFFNLIYKYALTNDLCDKNISDLIDISKYKNKNPAAREPAVFSPDEINYLWDNVNKDDIYSIMLMMLYTGCRIGELLNLKKADIHTSEKYLHIISAKTKAGIRRIPIHDKISPIMYKWYEASPTEYLICTHNGTHMLYRNFLATYWKPAMNKLGWKHRPHDTRHTFVSGMAAAGVDERIIRRIVGHSGKGVTERIYTHYDMANLYKAINLYDPTADADELI